MPLIVMQCDECRCIFHSPIAGAPVLVDKLLSLFLASAFLVYPFLVSSLCDYCWLPPVCVPIVGVLIVTSLAKEVFGSACLSVFLSVCLVATLLRKL